MIALYQPSAVSMSNGGGYAGLVRRFGEVAPCVLGIEAERVKPGFPCKRQARQWAKRCAREWQLEESV